MKNKCIYCGEYVPEGRQVVWVKYGLALEGWEPPAELQERMQGRNRFDMSPDDIAEVLNIDRATFYGYRSGFVYAAFLFI